MKNVPLKEAMITWTPAYTGKPDCIVVRNGDRDPRQLPYSCGACFTDWEKGTPAYRKLMLMVELWHIVARDGVPVDAVHKAMMAIPEYKDMLSEDFNLNPLWEKTN